METCKTPPGNPHARVRTPPAPLLGAFHDSSFWTPYSSRKSARLSQQRANRTPSPKILSRHFSASQQTPFLGSPQAQPKNDSVAAIGTPVTSPQKKRMPKMDSARRASGCLTADSTADAAAFLGPPPKTASGSGMLPTPAKTPQKPPTEQSKTKIKSFARNLFHSEEEAMPAPKKTRSQHRMLDSFSADQSDPSFRIFTDTNARVPEADNSVDNPFYGPGAAAAAASAQPSKRKGKGKRATVTVPGEGKVAIDELVGRDDGMVINFRGQKQYITFADNKDGGSVAEEESAALRSSASTSRRVTHSSIKPRLLFPPKASKETHGEDEEAATEIEDHALAANEKVCPETPVELKDGTPDTPSTPRFAPASPPTTARVTRHGSKTSAEASPMKVKTAGEKRNSPLGWRVSKGSFNAKHGVKRPANTETGSGSPVKRAKA